MAPVMRPAVVMVPAAPELGGAALDVVSVMYHVTLRLITRRCPRLLVLVSYALLA